MIKRSQRPAQTFIIKTAGRGEERAGALVVHTGSVGYWIDDGDEWERLLAQEPREKRMRSLNFSKSTPIFTIAPERFGLLIDRVEAAGLRKLPVHRSAKPPENQAYYMMQIGHQRAEIFVKPTPTALSQRVHAKELTLSQAQDIADSWSRVKTEVYKFGQYSTR